VTEMPVVDPTVVDAPVIQIVRGEPAPEELAALVAVLTAVAVACAAEAGSAPTAPSGWTDRSRYVRGALAHSPNGWRAAAFPR